MPNDVLASHEQLVGIWKVTMMRFAPCVAAATVLCFASSPSGTTLSKPIAH